MTDEKQDQNSDELDIFFLVGIPMKETDLPLKNVQLITKEVFGWALRDKRAGKIQRAINQRIKILDAYIVKENSPISKRTAKRREAEFEKLYNATKRLKDIIWDTNIFDGKTTRTPNPFAERALRMGDNFEWPPGCFQDDMQAIIRIFERAKLSRNVYKKRDYYKDLEATTGSKVGGDHALNMVTDHILKIYQEFVDTSRIGSGLSGQTFLFVRNIIEGIYKFLEHEPPTDKKIHSVARKLLRKTSK